VEIDCWDGDGDDVESPPGGAPKKTGVTEPIVLHGTPTYAVRPFPRLKLAN
jgi:hypothetical protein